LQVIVDNLIYREIVRVNTLKGEENEFPRFLLIRIRNLPFISALHYFLEINGLAGDN